MKNYSVKEVTKLAGVSVRTLHYYDKIGLLKPVNRTEAGYRYFVERLMVRSELTESEQRLIRHQFHQARLDMEQWMKLAAAMLAHTTKSASVITMPLSNRCRVKQIELISISDGLVLVVLILQDGLIKQ